MESVCRLHIWVGVSGGPDVDEWSEKPGPEKLSDIDMSHEAWPTCTPKRSSVIDIDSPEAVSLSAPEMGSAIDIPRY